MEWVRGYVMRNIVGWGVNFEKEPPSHQAGYTYHHTTPHHGATGERGW